MALYTFIGPDARACPSFFRHGKQLPSYHDKRTPVSVLGIGICPARNDIDLLSKSEKQALATAMVHAFCGAVEAAGYYAMNYTNRDYLSRYFDESTLEYDLWLAQWPNKPDLEKPPEGAGIWQYSSKGSVAGIKGNVDMDAAYKDYKAIIAKAGLNGLAKAEEPKKEEPKEKEPWYAEAQKWVKAKGISDGTKPNTPTTRAEVWEMLHRALGG